MSTNVQTKINFPFPSTELNVFTIYSIDLCPYCEKVKNLLINEQVLIINCDEFKKNYRDDFLVHMDLFTNGHRSFPMVFHNNKFIGGFDNTKTYYDQNQINKTNVEKSLIEINDF